MGFKHCSVKINDVVFSEPCFMTGEYCSKQHIVHRERERLHNEGKINAFVVMSFTDMTDVMYEWRIQSFIRSLAKNLYFVSDEKVSIDEFSSAFNTQLEVDTLKREIEKLAENDTDNTKQNSAQNVQLNSEFSRYLEVVSDKEKLPDTFSNFSFSSLRCYANKNEHLQKLLKDLSGNCYTPEYRVKEINVIRADSNPSSNFVICNRVCHL